MYKCESPICKGYETKYRFQIHYHHIIPIEHGGNNFKLNRIFLCPNCHSKIFIENSTAGIHSIKGDDSIIIKRWLYSTGGKVLEYINGDNSVCLY